MPTRELVPEPPYAFLEVTRLLRTGGRDPTFRRHDDGFTSAHRFATGEATLDVRCRGARVVAEAWGPGADEALERLPRRLGLHEAPWSLPPGTNPRVDQMLKAHPGLRLVDTGDAYEALVNIVPQQLVTWAEAASSWRQLVERLGTPAPGPAAHALGLMLPPTPKALASAGTAQLQACGLGSKRARVLVDVGRRAGRLQEAAAMPTADAVRRLTALPGIGPWTATSVLGMRLGRPEPVLLGDYHMPHTVAWGLAGEPRGTEARMLELLAPYEGQAFRVLRLLHAARVSAPKRGPRRQAFADHR
jgi:3-methyladenine DNA glycosylase/8-oxoguanine DNA glycosylase